MKDLKCTKLLFYSIKFENCSGVHIPEYPLLILVHRPNFICRQLTYDGDICTTLYEPPTSCYSLESMKHNATQYAVVGPGPQCISQPQSMYKDTIGMWSPLYAITLYCQNQVQ